MGEEKQQRLVKSGTRAPRQKQSKEVFAEGLCFKKLFFIFLLGSVFGTIYEDLLIYFTKGVFMLHRGVIWGPFNVIYGLGAAVMCWVLLRKKFSNWQVFGLSALLGGVIEYTLSLLQEIFTGTTSWDYSNRILNIQGRTTIPIMLLWGLMGLILVRLVYPLCSKLIEKIPAHVGNVVFWALLVLMSVDCLVSWTALIRQALRHNNMPPLTPVGRLCDEYFTDEYLHHYFPNMVRTGDKDA